MPSIIVRGDRAIRAFRAGAQRARTLARPMRVIATRLRRDILQNFARGGWFPQRWEPSIRARVEGGKTLVGRGILRNSISARSDARSARAGTSVLYGAVHQRGAVIRPRRAQYLHFRIGERWVRKRQVTIPARPFLPVKAGRLHPGTQHFVDKVLENWVAHGRPSPV